MKNGDLIVHGKRADELDIKSFTDPADMTSWEMDSYTAYDELHGDGACENAGIDWLHDLYGEEFDRKFFRHKERLRALKYREEALEELKLLQERIAGYDAKIKDMDND